MRQRFGRNQFIKGAGAAVAAAAMLIGAPQAASAESILAVTTANVLLSFDSGTPGTTSSTALTGTGAEQILGIDFRPATNQLFGLGSASNLYVIDALTGNAALVGMLGAPLSGASFGVDFNPTVDRLRVVSDADQNLRINPASPAAGTLVDTSLTYPGAPTANPNVVGSAYTNSFAGATSTTLYGIDFVTNALVTQTPANDGTLQTVGMLGFDATSMLGFDISGQTGTAYAAWATAAGPSPFYTINLGTGAASLVGPIGTPAGQQVRGLAVAVPEPALMGLLGMGLVMVVRRKGSWQPC